MNRATLILSLTAAAAASGCTFQEELPEVDLTGVVRLPKAAATFDYSNDPSTTDPTPITDERGLGPVYIGAFPSVRAGLYDYPHPEIGPVLNTSQEGNTYPYGGTTIGRFDWGCYQELICKIVTGRYETYDDVLDFFATQLDDPISDSAGIEVTEGTVFQEQCYEVLFQNYDAEVLFIDPETDFVENGEYYEAEVDIPHTIFAEGMAVWGWMDAPAADFTFSTCDPSVGDLQNYYDEQFSLGTNPLDVLNYPGNYIDAGDWVVNEPAIINDPEANFVLDSWGQFTEDGYNVDN